MTLDQIISLLTPILSGASGILISVAVFVAKIKSLRSEVKSQMTNNAQITNELNQTKQALIDVKVKFNAVIEDIKEIKECLHG